MALTKIGTDGVKDDAVTSDKVANAINSAIAANTAKDLTALSAANLTSGTIPDARFPATLPAASAANLTAVPAANITGTLPAISATNLTNVPAANITGTLPAISGANLTNLPASGKATNLVINGAMNVAQRATSSTVSGYGSVDRWQHEYAGTDEAPTFAQSDVVSSDSGDNPFAKGITKCFKITNGNQTGGFQNNRILNFNQNFEAQDVRNSGWNYNSSSSYMTLSFYVKASVSQNYHGFVKTQDGTNYIWQYETGVLTANTWTRIIKTFPGNSNLQINNDNTGGFQVFPIFFGGSDYTDNSINHTDWQSWSSGIRSKDQTATWWTTNDATLEITGVQLEVGDAATDFAHESYNETLQKCKRYCHVIASGSYSLLGIGMQYYSGYLFIDGGPIDMRTTPTMVAKAGSSGAYVYEKLFGNSAEYIHQIGLDSKTKKDRVLFDMLGTASRHGQAARCSAHSITLNNNEPFVYLTAEL